MPGVAGQAGDCLALIIWGRAAGGLVPPTLAGNPARAVACGMRSTADPGDSSLLQESGVTAGNRWAMRIPSRFH